MSEASLGALCEAIEGEFVHGPQWCMATATGGVDCDDAWCPCDGAGHWACPEHGGPATAKGRPEASGGDR
jgi:hypothetical protein